MNQNFNLKLDKKIIDILKNAEEIEIYLIEPEVGDFQMSKSIIVNHVFLKTDLGLFRLEGCVENFSINRDEVFGLELKNGWVEFECKFENNQRTITWGEEYFHFRENPQLIQYNRIERKEQSVIKIRSDLQEIYDISSKTGYPVEVDDAILLHDNTKTIYLGKHLFPYSILVTDNEFEIKQLGNW